MSEVPLYMIRAMAGAVAIFRISMKVCVATIWPLSEQGINSAQKRQRKIETERERDRERLIATPTLTPCVPPTEAIFEHDCRGTSLIRNTPLLGPYSRTIPRVLWWS